MDWGYRLGNNVIYPIMKTTSLEDFQQNQQLKYGTLVTRTENNDIKI